MPTAARTIDLAASIEQAWGVATTVALWPRWLAPVHQTRALSTPGERAGSTFEVQRTGQRRTERWLIADWERYQRVRFTDIGYNVQFTLRFNAQGATTTLHALVQWPEPRGLFRHALDRSPGKQYGHALEASLERLREVVKKG